MIDEMRSEARAEIEQGERYRETRLIELFLKVVRSKSIRLAVLCMLLFCIGLTTALTSNGPEGDFNYRNPLGGEWNGILSVLGTSLWAGALIWLFGAWKWKVRARLTLVFLLLPVIAWINDPPSFMAGMPLGDVEHLTSVTYQGHVYHLERQYFSGIYLHLYECDSSGRWCHEVRCFPYDEAVTNEYGYRNEIARKVAESFPICSTGERLPPTSP
jgi:hypothetical protein